MPIHLAVAPVAMMRAWQVYSASAVVTRKGRCERSTWVASAATMRVPNRSACAFISSMRAGPMMPSRKPGKFSTSVVMVSWPPGCIPSRRSGLRVARAA